MQLDGSVQSEFGCTVQVATRTGQGRATESESQLTPSKTDPPNLFQVHLFNFTRLHVERERQTLLTEVVTVDVWSDELSFQPTDLWSHHISHKNCTSIYKESVEEVKPVV